MMLVEVREDQARGQATRAATVLIFGASFCGIPPTIPTTQLGREVSVPTVKQRLAGVRHLFDWLVIGQVIMTNPAALVRDPTHRVRRGKTPVLAPDEARRLLDAIDVSTPAGLRGRALIGLMVYSFARIGAALGMRVEDVFVQNPRL